MPTICARCLDRSVRVLLVEDEPPMADATFGGVTRPRRLHVPSRTVRLRLTLLYGGLFLISGVALLAITYLIFRGASGVDLIVQHGSAHASPGQDAATRLTYARLVRRSTDALHQG